MNLRTFSCRLGFCVCAAAAWLGFLAQGSFAADQHAVTITVTAVGNKNTAPPAVTAPDVQFYPSKERKQVAAWRHGDALQLAILIDDSLNTNAASQWSDLKAFILAQPKTTAVAVVYARNGSAVVAQDFTTDHVKAAKALRIPIGSGAFSSPYLALLDLIKRWPSAGERCSVLMISSGIDYFRGGPQLLNPDVDTAVEHAEKRNINVWTIYYPDAVRRRRGFFGATNAQSNLTKLSDETGAESYYLALSAPVSIKPYLDEIRVHLQNQYLLTFYGNGGKKGRFESVKLSTELSKVKFLTPKEVFLPASS